MTIRSHFMCVVAVSLVFSASLFCFLYVTGNGSHISEIQNETPVAIVKDGIEETVLILLWTGIGGKFEGWTDHFGNDAKFLNKCKEKIDIFPTFNLTMEKKMISNSSLVIFNLNDLNFEGYSDKRSWIDNELPKYRKEHQIWALFWREPPSRIKLQESQMPWLDGIFNWTISYRRDSDVFYPFGFIEEKSSKGVFT